MLRETRAFHVGSNGDWREMRARSSPANHRSLSMVNARMHDANTVHPFIPQPLKRWWTPQQGSRNTSLTTASCRYALPDIVTMAVGRILAAPTNTAARRVPLSLEPHDEGIVVTQDVKGLKAERY
ncbi:hypothetical protein DOTSEDRAFT_74441 [Dothistroma septosporum NZE10]|uniref:Uncharacterized protein n=1 Tax=Dothistroma septosporum (strain NZE10 / CBS 128990) TaxID=675120 RepID=N1PE40_DOTSN|nr:hypothetical protein DOTSEDRAFT_74441 [Dothistroma septosporum NZE10]